MIKKIFFSFIFLSWICELKCLRIITFNLNCEINWNSKKDNIVKLLKELDADIICLQEVPIKRHAQQLANELKMYWDEKAWHIGGMTILTKFKILQMLKQNIPNSYCNGIVAVKIEPDTWVVSVHLSSTNYQINDSERLRELRFIVNELNKTNAHKVILAGDFNSFNNVQIDKLLIINGYIDTHKGKYWIKGTWMQGSNLERIDRIYVKGNFKIQNGKVIDHTDISWLRKTGWPTGNDHRLVVSDVS